MAVEPLHIAYIVSHFAHPAFGHDGGLGTSVYNLVEQLLKSNITVTVFVYGQKEEFEIREQNLTLYSIKQISFPVATFYFYRKYLNRFIAAKIKADRIMLLEAPDWTGITAFMKFNIPVIIRFHGSDTYFCHLEKRKQKRKNYLFEKCAISSACSYIAPTTFAGEITAKLFGIEPVKVRTIHYGLNLQKFINPDSSVFTHGLILYVGTIIRKKGVLELPHIFRKVLSRCPHAKLVLVGSDAPDAKTGESSTINMVYEQLSSEELHSVTYVNRLPYSQISSLMQSANVCIFPTFAETLGMVTIEAMAMHKAVVNSNIGWANELMVDGSSGFLVHPEDHDLFAGRIVDIINNESLAAEIGQNARKYIEENFDIISIARQNIDFYKSEIAKN